ncbi:PepSY-like domain-containing protein [Epilithonimonas hungarica]|uniref:Putative beta-lactamase-inhibitor-like, PepSY-like n=1 Tax=Epilithonimonas hungarica TaxID=454006 RepID=A0A1G7JMQ7_9FLAO|nr:PepSY-like domain-containing protein [Epilithonimonas hungarica]SDF26171.1 Putative beta-lactamase-inhibitor-like, PepSY-like [Epilithonimonas hungarica]
MKLNKPSLILMFSGVLFVQAVGKNEITLNPDVNSVKFSALYQEMPATIKSFLAKYYPKATVVKYEAKSTVVGKKYEVKLNNGAEIDFDKNGNWEEISDKQGIVSALIPAKIKAYLDQHYKGIKVESIDKERNKIKVDLQNDIDLEFDKNGKFLRVD